MRIVQVYGGPVFGVLGGHEYVVRTLSENLSSRGVQVNVLSPGLYGSVICRKIRQIEYIEISSYRLQGRTSFPALRFLPLIVRSLSKADVIHVHCPDNPFAFFLAILAKSLKKRMVTTILAYADDFKHHDKARAQAGDPEQFGKGIIRSLSNSAEVEIPPDIWDWNRVVEQFKLTYNSLADGSES